MAKTRIELFVHLCLTTSDRPQMQTRHIMRQNALLLSPSGPIPYGILRQQSWRKNDINCVNQQARRLYERVSERLAEENECYDLTPDPAPPVATPLPEAPASVNVRVVVAGYEVQWTLRDVDETRLAGRLAALLAQYPKEGTASPSGAASAPQPPVCRFHGPMKASSKAPGSFYCTKKLHDGSYCLERGGAL
jgi:hypothetical protein